MKEKMIKTVLALVTAAGMTVLTGCATTQGESQQQTPPPRRRIGADG